MSRFVINTVGSTGDLLPFIALAKGLQSRGHSVVMPVNAAMHATIEKAGIETLPCGPRLSPDDARERPELFDGSRPMRQIRHLFNEYFIPSMPESYRQLLDACKDADALIATSIQFAAPLVHEKTGIPFVTVLLSPCQLATAEDTPPQWPDHPWMRKPVVLRAGWALAKAVTRWAFLPQINKARKQLGFKPLKGAPTLEDFSKQLVLLASSKHFSPPRQDWPEQVRQTGYWFYDGKDQRDWQPDAALKTSLENGPAPVVLTLGSMVQRDPERVVQLHARAVMKLKQRLVIQQGWAQLSTENLRELTASGQVIGAGFVPHDWLFEHARAVIHHGGAGTTARCLRLGRPALLEPHGFDQPFNGQHVRDLGAGDYIHSHHVTERRLVAKLERVLDENVRQRATQLGTLIRAEDGVREACEHIEALVRQRPGDRVNA